MPHSFGLVPHLSKELRKLLYASLPSHRKYQYLFQIFWLFINSKEVYHKAFINVRDLQTTDKDVRFLLSILRMDSYGTESHLPLLSRRNFLASKLNPNPRYDLIWLLSIDLTPFSSLCVCARARVCARTRARCVCLIFGTFISDCVDDKANQNIDIFIRTNTVWSLPDMSDL